MRIKGNDGQIYDFPDDTSYQEISEFFGNTPNKNDESSQYANDNYKPSLMDLNNDYSKPNNIIGKIAESAPVNAVLGAGDAMRNLLSLGYLSKSPSSNFGFNPGSESGEGLSYNVGKLAGDIGGFLGGGEVLDTLRFAGEGLPAAGKALQYLGKESFLPGITRRVGGSALVGSALNPDERLKGAGEGAALGALFEPIQLGLRGAKGIAEMINPEGFSSSVGEKFTKDYLSAKRKSSQFYNKVTDKLGQKNIYESKGTDLIGEPNVTPNLGSYRNLDEEIIGKYFTPKVKKLHEDFLKDPTLNNAHRLQKQLGEDGARFLRNKKDPTNYDVGQSMNYARNLLDNDIKSYLKMTDKKAAQTWQKGIDTYREKVAPYLSSTPLRNLATGNVQTISPKRAINIMRKEVEKKNPYLNAIGEKIERPVIPENHYIQEMLKKMESKYYGGKALKEIMPEALRKWMPNVIGMAQNPKVIELGEKGSPYYEAIKNSIIALMIGQ